MPTANPRLTVTLTPALGTLLTRLNEITGNSKSGMISELLEGAQPVFERMVQVLEAAEKAKGALRKEVAQGFEDAETALNAQLGLTMDMFQKQTGDMIDTMETIERRSGSAGKKAKRSLPPSGAPTQPPYLTGGSQRPSDSKKAKGEGVGRPVKTLSKASKLKAKG